MKLEYSLQIVEKNLKHSIS